MLLSKKFENHHKKLIIFILLTAFIQIQLFAISTSFNDSISAVYPDNSDDFAANMLPLNTSFLFYSYPQILPDYFSPAYARIRMGFYFGNSWQGEYEYSTGFPLWTFKAADSNIDWTNRFSIGSYFKGSGDLDMNIEQGFFTNPVAGSGNLMEIALGFRSYFFGAYEPLALHSGNTSTIFMDINGQYTGNYSKFAPGNKIQAYHWLEGNRLNLNNYLYSYLELILDKSTGFGISDGFYIDTGLYYGPWWLANNIDDNITSDFFQTYFTLQEKMSLYSRTQENGMNWLSIQLVHSNTLMHTQGNVIPEHMIPLDRLSNSFSDSLYLNINGPQFISWDSYTYINLGLSNTLAWGKVVNEQPQTTKALELRSSLYMLFHLRLFGFMRFEYQTGYTFGRGVYTYAPGWSHSAKLTFFITV